MTEPKTKSKWKSRLHEIIYEADTKVGRTFDIVLLIVILFSIVLVMLESIEGLNNRYYMEFYVAEWVITFVFTIEYILRIVTIKKPLNYIFSFYGIVDLLSTLPSYLTFFIPGSHNLLFAVRALRLLRIFRILKITRYVGESDKLVKALKQSRPKILIFLFAVVIISVIMGSVMFMVEGPENGFTSIPVSIYWCIVTLTTVGFGDIHPVTSLGQFIASFIMVVGYGIIAVPTGIVSAEFSRATTKTIPTNTQVCPYCNEHKHLDGAEFCHNCGNVLNE